MGLIGLAKVVLIGLAIWLLYRGIKSVMAGNAQKRRTMERGDASSGEVLDVMVQCAQCGTYLPRKEALLDRARGEQRYFCGADCRHKFALKDENTP